MASRSGGVRVPFPPPLLYVAGLLLGLALEVALPSPSAPFPPALAAGAVGLVGWLCLDGAAMLLFHRAGTSVAPGRPVRKLVTSGPYRMTRNPMYVGMTFLYLGLALSLGATLSLALLPAVLLMIDRMVIAREERYLEERFGEDYRAYRRRVRRWL
jgi:protein-S-isoprenylcysteine O-methyltransferase Ste14